jgi:quercetin dioxygenase-like cupin family protein
MRVNRTDDNAETEAIPGVHLTQLAVGDGMSLQRGRLDPGAEIPEHSHPHEQLGYVIQGELTLILNGEEVGVKAGESFMLEGDEPHAAANRGDEPMIAIDGFCPARENPPWQE